MRSPLLRTVTTASRSPGRVVTSTQPPGWLCRNLRTTLADYLKLRRGLGFGLRRDEKLLVQFLDYLDELGHTSSTVDDALAWAKLPEPASPGWLGIRLSLVRSFAAYLRTLDVTAPVVSPGLLPGRGPRAVPHLYSDEDLAALLREAESLKTPLRSATMRTLIGLLAVTGIRLGEALAVDDADFDAAAGVLLVRHGKFGKQRRSTRPSIRQRNDAIHSDVDGGAPTMGRRPGWRNQPARRCNGGGNGPQAATATLP
jgi:hypothetical protein